MSKISKSLYKIKDIEVIANGDDYLHKIHPLVKLLITIVYIIIVVSLNKYNLSKILLMVVYPSVIFASTDIPLKLGYKGVLVALPFCILAGIGNIVFDNVIIGTFYGYYITAGMLSAVVIVLKCVLTVLATYILIASTGINNICYALRILHVPNVLINQVLLTYRYIFILILEVENVSKSYSLRAPNHKGIHFKIWGSLLGQLLLNSIKKANDIFNSMTMRNFKDKLYYYKPRNFKVIDPIYTAFWVVVLVGLVIL